MVTNLTTSGCFLCPIPIRCLKGNREAESPDMVLPSESSHSEKESED